MSEAVDDFLAIPNQRNRQQSSDDINKSFWTPILVELNDRFLDNIDGKDVTESFLDMPQLAES